MIRKQIYLDPQQDQALKLLAQEQGITESDVLRQSLVTFMTERQERPLRRPVYHDAWQHTMALIRDRARRFPSILSVPDQANLWTGEGTYMVTLKSKQPVRLTWRQAIGDTPASCARLPLLLQARDALRS